MPVTMTPISGAGDLTYSSLVQAARDQLRGQNDETAIRRAGRIVNDSLKFLAAHKRWNWYMRLWTVALRPKTTLTSRVSMAVDAAVATLTTGTWPSNAADRTLVFSGDTSLFRIRSRDSSTQVTMFSNEIWAASAAKSVATAYLVYDRQPLPANYRTLIGVPQERDQPNRLIYLSPREFLEYRMGYAPTYTDPVHFTIYMNHATQRWELLWWPAPATLREASFWIYVAPTDLTDDAQVADWDPALSFALHAAIDLFVDKELKDSKRYPASERAFREAVLVAKQHDETRIIDVPAGPDWPARGSKIQRSAAALADE